MNQEKFVVQSIRFDEAVGEARALLDGGLDVHGWGALCRLADRLKIREQRPFVEFVVPQLERMGPEVEALRVAPERWVRDVIDAIDSPRLALVSVIALGAMRSEQRSLACPSLVNVRRLAIEDRAIHARLLDAIVGASFAPGLRELTLTGSYAESALRGGIPGSLPSLRRLHIATTDYGSSSKSMSRLIRSSAFSSAEVLSLFWDPGLPETIAGLGRGFGSSLRELELRATLARSFCPPEEEGRRAGETLFELVKRPIFGRLERITLTTRYEMEGSIEDFFDGMMRARGAGKFRGTLDIRGLGGAYDGSRARVARRIADARSSHFAQAISELVWE